MQKHGFSKDEIAFMGDDLPDICVLESVGMACCPLDAVDEVKDVCNYISTKNGGEGAVREVCEFILRAQGHNDLRALLETSARVKCGTRRLDVRTKDTNVFFGSTSFTKL